MDFRINVRCRVLFLVSCLLALVVAATHAQGADKPPQSGDGAAQGQNIPTNNPERLVTRMLEAMRSDNWPVVATLLHPEALASFHRIVTSFIAADVTGVAGKHFLQLKDAESVAALTPEVVFARCMGSMTTMVPSMNEMFQSSSTAILGSVAEGDMVHVVYRLTMTLEGAPLSKVMVLTAKRHDSEWRSLLTADMDAVVARLGRRSSTPK